MPIYEYLCPHCNRVFSFLTARVGDPRQPSCPRCGGAEMRKQVSRFAFRRGGGGRGAAGGDDAVGGDFGGLGGAGEGAGDPMDDPRVEREMMRLMSQAEHMDENDPRQLGQLMRRMSEITGEGLDAEMEEAVRRLEAGEDPDRVEEDLGEGLGGPGGDEGFGPPSYDEGLYTL